MSTTAQTRPSRARPVSLDHRVGLGLIRFLRRPAMFFAATWAALLGVVSVVGVVPALAGSTRVTTDPEADDDATFSAVLGHVRVTVRRDWPISLALWAFLGMLVGDAVILAGLADPGTRVFLGAAVAPVAWATIAWLSAYVVSAADPTLDRIEVARAATARCLRTPGRALLAPVLVIALSPVWLLAPLTIAVGFSLPPWVLGRFWGAATGG